MLSNKTNFTRFYKKMFHVHNKRCVTEMWYHMWDFNVVVVFNVVFNDVVNVEPASQTVVRQWTSIR